MNWKDKILPTVFELYMKYGIKSISMDDISRALGISKKSLYEVIENKSELVHQIVHFHIDNERKETQEIIEKSSNAIEAMFFTTRHVLKYMRKMSPSLLFDLKKYYPEVWNIIEESHFGYIKEVIQNNMIRGQSEGLYRNDFNPEIIAKLYISNALTVTNTEIFPLDQYDRAQLFEELINYHLQSITTDDGKETLKTLKLKQID